jgi:hypothetical protein
MSNTACPARARTMLLESVDRAFVTVIVFDPAPRLKIVIICPGMVPSGRVAVVVPAWVIVM